MADEKPAEPAPEAAPAAGMPRAKLLALAGGGGAVVLGLLAGLLIWLWPSAPDPAAVKAARERRAAAQAAAASAAAQADQVAQAASAALAASAAQAATEAPPADAATDVAAALPPAEADAAAPAPSPARAVQAPSKAEASLDHLQRRLGEVLGPRGAVDAARSGEWRVLTRASVAPASAAQASPAAAAAVADTAPRRRPAGGSVSDPAPRGPWAYDGPSGPQAWGRLKPEYTTCANGKRQSPIDIRDGLALDLEAVRFEYQPGGFAIIDTGSTVQINVPAGNAIEVAGRRYELQQFHFHRPSESRIDGRRFDMDVHLVHRDAEGRMAIVAVLLERGAAQPLLQTLWNHLPLEKGEEVAVRSVTIDPAQLLPADRRYYTFMGSMTTPPCSEGVLWVVLQQPLSVSAAQIDIFSRLYPMNARPIQQTAGRLIKQSN